MTQVLLDEIGSALRKSQEDRAGRCISYMRTFSVAPAQDRLAGLLDQIADHPAFGKGTFERALELARENR